MSFCGTSFRLNQPFALGLYRAPKGGGLCLDIAPRDGDPSGEARVSFWLADNDADAPRLERAVAAFNREMERGALASAAATSDGRLVADKPTP